MGRVQGVAEFIKDARAVLGEKPEGQVEPAALWAAFGRQWGDREGLRAGKRHDPRYAFKRLIWHWGVGWIGVGAN